MELVFINESQLKNIPEKSQFETWVEHVLPADKYWELVLTIIDEENMAELNQQFRNKSGATNVLSFPAQIPEGIDVPLLGDIIICAPVVAREAEEQQKQLLHHWAHLTIHGTLHLLGYDHMDLTEAVAMEQLEINAMETLGFPNPYIEVKQS